MICFYHKSDFDGKCSAAIVKFFKPETKLYGIDYGEPFPWDEIDDQEYVYMVDFCIQPYDDIIKLNENARLIWIDHHVTAMTAVDKLDYDGAIQGIRRDGTAACELVWEWFAGPQEENPLDMPRIVHLLGRYDVWDHSDKLVIPFQYGMRALAPEVTSPDNMSFWNDHFMSNSGIHHIKTVGTTIHKYVISSTAHYMDHLAYESEFLGLKCVAVNRGFISSYDFDDIYRPKDHALMVGYVLGQDGRWHYSLRTTHDYVHVGILAQVFGGGGHPQSAGFSHAELLVRPKVR